MKDHVILVNEKDEPLGSMDKLEVHQKGLLHRAFSVFVFNDAGQLLLQRRANNKYHSANLWTNTCCSHPYLQENTLDAARRRLKEEMGIDIDLEKKFDFIYQAKLDNGLTEHEFDHVYVGHYNGHPTLNPAEASEYRWVEIRELKIEIKLQPEEFTEWLKIAIDFFDQ
jgi:isopentenyl-diphosphate delta-isomerase